MISPSTNPPTLSLIICLLPSAKWLTEVVSKFDEYQIALGGVLLSYLMAGYLIPTEVTYVVFASLEVTPRLVDKKVNKTHAIYVSLVCSEEGF